MISVSCVTEKNSGDVMSAPHCHSTIEVDCILDGNGRYSVAGAVHDIAAGDVFVFCNNIIHRITSIAPDRAMKILKVHFSPSLLMQEGLFSGFDGIFFRTSGLTHIPSGTNESERVRRILEDMLAESGNREFKSDEMMTALLLTLCVTVGRYVGSNCPGDGASAYRSDNHSAISSTIQFINTNLAEKLDLDTLARMANMSKNSYLYWFRHFNGISPYSYIQSMRILRAVDMLKNTSDTIAHIAFSCGFNSTVSFNKMFKKVMGCTPGEVRRGAQRGKK